MKNTKLLRAKLKQLEAKRTQSVYGAIQVAPITCTDPNYRPTVL